MYGVICQAVQAKREGAGILFQAVSPGLVIDETKHISFTSLLYNLPVHFISHIGEML